MVPCCQSGLKGNQKDKKTLLFRGCRPSLDTYPKRGDLFSIYPLQEPGLQIQIQTTQDPNLFRGHLTGPKQERMSQSAEVQLQDGKAPWGRGGCHETCLTKTMVARSCLFLEKEASRSGVSGPLEQGLFAMGVRPSVAHPNCGDGTPPFCGDQGKPKGTPAPSLSGDTLLQAGSRHGNTRK